MIGSAPRRETRLLWLLFAPLALLTLFFALSSTVQGQGPVLTSLPTPTPVAPGPDDLPPSDLVAQAARPDLVVTKIDTKPATPLVGEPTVISVTIKNLGPGSMTSQNNFFTDLYIDPPFQPIVNYHQIVSPTIGLPWGAQWFFVKDPGATYVFTTTWVFTDVRTYNVWALVDSNGQNDTDIDGNVTEANEDNNARQVSISVRVPDSFVHDTHEDFLTNMASTLDNSDAYGTLRLGTFQEPPFFARPFANASCEITPGSVGLSDYNMQSPDTRINEITGGRQVNPRLVTNDNGVVVAVWQDGREGDTFDRDIYLRYSPNWGQSWGPEIRINDDPATYHVNQLNPAVALGTNGDLLVAWQDSRSAVEAGCSQQCYDIFTQRFLIGGGNLTRVGSNMLVGGLADYTIGDQVNPDITVDETGNFHIAWQDNRNGSNDIFGTSYELINGTYTWMLVRRIHDDFDSTQQENPSIEALDWRKVTRIEYEISPAPPYVVTVTQVISEPATILVVAWEDDRLDPAPNDTTEVRDIALVASGDGGETFGVDGFITHSDTDGLQQNPDVAVTKSTTEMDLSVPLPDGTSTTVKVNVPASDIHTVWEGYSTSQNTDRDVYYNVSQLVTEQLDEGHNDQFRFKLEVSSSLEKINQNDVRSWQTTPVDQSAPAVAAVPCGPNAEEDEWNVFMAWADGRNYDSANYDIFYALKSTCGSDLGGNRLLNDGVHLYDYNTSNPSWDEYDAGHPPPGRQINPTVAADIQLKGMLVSGGYVYLAWEDDRAGDPQAQRDVYFARTNLTFSNQPPYSPYHDGAGSQISNVLDSGSEETVWYTIEWAAQKPTSTYVTVQTRLGNTLAEVLGSEWYPQRFPYQPQPGDCQATGSGAPLPGYDAPGQHVEGTSGDFWPRARYIQYRVNFYTRDAMHTPELDRVTIYYDNGPDGGDTPHTRYTYLPVVIKQR